MKWIGLFGVGIFLVATAARVGGGLVDAKAALENGDYAKAVEIASKVADSSKDKSKALCIVGDAENARENWVAAETAFRAALAKKNEFVPAMAGLGQALVAQGKLADAGPVLSKAVQLDNTSIPAWHALCASIIARGKPDDFEAARTNLNATLMLDAKNPITNRMMVEVLLKLDKVDDAEKAAETYAKADKDSATSWFLRGIVHERRKNFDKAVEAHQKAVKKDDRMRDAHMRLALLLMAAKSGEAGGARAAEALVHAQRYVDLGGKDARVVELLAKLESSSPPAK